MLKDSCPRYTGLTLPALQHDGPIRHLSMQQSDWEHCGNHCSASQPPTPCPELGVKAEATLSCHNASNQPILASSTKHPLKIHPYLCSLERATQSKVWIRLCLHIQIVRKNISSSKASLLRKYTPLIELLWKHHLESAHKRQKHPQSLKLPDLKAKLCSSLKTCKKKKGSTYFLLRDVCILEGFF